MNSARRLSCAALLLAVGVSLAVAPSASAQSERVEDAIGDVTTTTIGPRTTPYTVPEEAETDIVRVDFDYRQRALVASIRVREIRGKGKRVDLFVRVQAGGKALNLSPAPGGRVMVVSDTYPGPVCPGATSKVDTDDKTFRMRVPNRCFGAPDKVRLGAIVDRYRVGTDDEFRTFTDDARNGRVKKRKGSYIVSLGKPLRRG